MQFSAVFLKKYFSGHRTIACRSIGRSVVIFLWMALTAFLPKYRRLEEFFPPKLVQLSTESQVLGHWHGTAILYRSIPQVQHALADLLDPLWYQVQPLAECRFRVDRPESLNKIQDSALRHLARQFERYGYRVKELHLSVGGMTITYFLG